MGVFRHFRLSAVFCVLKIGQQDLFPIGQGKVKFTARASAKILTDQVNSGLSGHLGDIGRS